MINLRQIEVFYAIMRAGSITEAARVLNVTQPAVSAALKQLEARLRMKLFDREGGRLRPTPEARALLPDVAEIFGRLGAVERFSADLAGGSRGVITIAATPPLCDGFAAKAVATFVAKRPGVKVSLISLASPMVLDRVANREVDIGLCYEPIVSRAVHVEEIVRSQIGCILTARHPLAKRKSIRVRDLAPYPVVTYLPQALLRPHIDRAFSDKSSAPRLSVETSYSSTAIMLVLHGAGVAIVETALIAARPVPGLVVRPLDGRIDLKGLLIRPRQGAGSPVLEDFVAHLRQTFP
ncbi:MAG TPA: LysR family transcriptional regulator [Usitatibacter sp.]|jgi:DNA-binding transcriptional LysR family regulator|nr:LysR family transcriptional regulator [Usitatibacter sp.]